MYRLHLCVNDQRGNPDDRLYEFEVSLPDGSTIISLEAKDDCICKFQANRGGALIGLGTETFAVQSYQTWVGNICWDACEADAETTLAILNLLRDTGQAMVVEADEDLFDIWHDDGPLTYADIGADEPSEASKLERLGIKPLFDLDEVG